MLYLQNGTLLWLVSTHGNTLHAYFWSQCILEETKLKEKDGIDPNGKSQAFIARVKKLKKGKFGKSKKKYMSKVQCFKYNELGHFKRDCPSQRNKKRKERSEAHVAEEVG